MDYSFYNRPAYAELEGERGKAIGVRLVPSRFESGLTSATDLVGLLARQLRVRSSLLVDVLRDWLQVCRIYAGTMLAACSARTGQRVMAAMVELQSGRDRPDEAFVEEAGGLHDSSTLAVPDARIAARGECAAPDPARRLVAKVADVVSTLERLWRTTSSWRTPVVPVDESLRLTFVVALRGRGVEASRFAASAFTQMFGHIHIYAHASVAALAAARST